MATKLSTITKEELEEIIKISYTYSDVLRMLGCSPTNGGSFRTLKNKIAQWDIKTSHFKQITTGNKILVADDLLIENCKHNRKSLKKYIIKHNLIPYKCAICGNVGKWNNKPLTLTLDHINGINNDNRLENLQFVCPNCDSQQDTYGSKNFKNTLKYKNINLDNDGRELYVSNNKHVRRCAKCGKEISASSSGLCVECYRKIQRKNIPSKKTLINELKTFVSFVELGKRLGVTDNCIKKWLRIYNIPYLKKDLLKWIEEMGD